MAYNWTENQRATWAIGAFTNQTGFDQPPTFVFDHWGLDMPMRATYLPWYDEASGGRGLLHTGLDYVYRSAPDNTMTLAARPESAFAPSVVNMTLTDLNDMQVAGRGSSLGLWAALRAIRSLRLDRQSPRRRQQQLLREPTSSSATSLPARTGRTTGRWACSIA